MAWNVEAWAYPCVNDAGSMVGDTRECAGFNWGILTETRRRRRRAGTLSCGHKIKISRHQNMACHGGEQGGLVRPHGGGKLGRWLGLWYRILFLPVLTLLLNGTAHGTGGIAAESTIQCRRNSLCGHTIIDHIHPSPSLGHHQVPVKDTHRSDDTQTFSQALEHDGIYMPPVSDPVNSFFEHECGIRKS